MLPREYGSSSTCHRRFQEWNKLDVFKKTWARLLKVYDKEIGINWDWQSIDSISIYEVTFRGAKTGNNPTTDRSKLGTKRHILTDKRYSMVCRYISSASTHDNNLVTDVADNTVIKRPQSKSSSSKSRSERRGRGRRRKRFQHLCLDKECNSKEKEQELMKRGCILHIRIKIKRDKNNEKEIPTREIPHKKNIH